MRFDPDALFKFLPIIDSVNSTRSRKKGRTSKNRCYYDFVCTSHIGYSEMDVV